MIVYPPRLPVSLHITADCGEWNGKFEEKDYPSRFLLGAKYNFLSHPYLSVSRFERGHFQFLVLIELPGKSIVIS